MHLIGNLATRSLSVRSGSSPTPDAFPDHVGIRRNPCHCALDTGLRWDCCRFGRIMFAYCGPQLPVNTA